MQSNLGTKLKPRGVKMCNHDYGYPRDHRGSPVELERSVMKKHSLKAGKHDLARQEEGERSTPSKDQGRP